MPDRLASDAPGAESRRAAFLSWPQRTDGRTPSGAQWPQQGSDARRMTLLSAACPVPASRPSASAWPATPTAVQVPARYSRVDPWVISSDTDAEIRFVEAAFAGRETPGSRMLGPDGRVGHVEVEIGDAVLMMFDAAPDWPLYPAHLRVYVADAREAYERALAAGAREVTSADRPGVRRVCRPCTRPARAPVVDPPAHRGRRAR